MPAILRQLRVCGSGPGQVHALTMGACLGYVDVDVLQVHVIASLPCYGADNVDKQRGRGVFERSIEVGLGFGVRIAAVLLLKLEGWQACPHMRSNLLQVVIRTS